MEFLNELLLFPNWLGHDDDLTKDKLEWHVIRHDTHEDLHIMGIVLI